MLTELHLKNVASSEALRALFDRECGRIEGRFPNLVGDRLRLRGDVALGGRAREGAARLTLTWPRHRVHSEGSGPDAVAALRDAFHALDHEIERVRARERTLRRRLATRRRPAVGSPSGNGASHDEAASLDDEQWALVFRKIPELERFLAREIVRHRERLEREDLDELDVSDLAEEAVVHALATLEQRPDDVPLDRWLFTAAWEVLRDEEGRLEARGETLSLEETVPEEVGVDSGEADPEELAEGPHDEERLGDGVAATGPDLDPVERAGLDELDDVLRRALEGVSEEARGAVRLHLEGEEDVGRIARRLGRPEAEVRALLDDGLRSLRRELERWGGS